MKHPLYFVVALVILASIGLFVGAAQPQDDRERFSFNGKPIHPMSVAPLVGDLADEQPRIAAVDLEGSARNKSNGAKLAVENGVVTAQDGDGFVAYRLVGTTPGGLYVLIVMVNGGGSGVFEDALWVRTVRDRIWEDGKWRERTMLVRGGQFTLGDRDNGTVRLEGANLFIGKSRYREKDTTIPVE